MNSMNTTITIPATMSKGRTKYEHANTVYGEQRWEWGVPQRNYLLSVYTQVETAENIYVVIRDADSGEIIAKHPFRDCETQPDDAQRWLNDTIRYPNPFATTLANEEWR